MSFNCIVLFLLPALLAASSSFLSPQTYNPTLASKYWDLCIASYCSSSKIQDWSISFMKQRFPSVRDITVIHNTTGNSFGFLAYNADENEVWIVFRGTEPLSIKNWIDDFNFLFIDYEKCEGCRVHRGFYFTYLEIKDRILGAAKDLFQKYPTAKKIVTGHSLGGALAVQAILDIVENFGEIHEFYTYGAPRGGNKAFVDYINAKIKVNFNTRITHARDPVPHLPFLSWGYWHIDREVFYESGLDYVICEKGEDSNCSNKYWLATSVVDHLVYMGKDMVPYYLECKLF